MMRKFFGWVKQICEELDRKPIGETINTLEELKRTRGRLFILGLGGSAANASHAVNDFRKLCEIECYAPTDNVAELTARANDDGFVNIFKKWLQTSRINKRDVVMALSVGGGSKERNLSLNIVKAMEYAKKVKAKTISIVGRDGGELKKISDITIQIPTVNEYLVTPFVESFQVIILHLLAFHPTLQENQGTWEQIELDSPVDLSTLLTQDT